MIRVLILLFASCLSALAQTNYTEAMYRYALNDDSTAPLYVLISLREDNGDVRQICIPAPFLRGAIHIQDHLDYDPAGQKKILDIAVKQYGKVFSFTDPEARRNVQPSYSPKVLAKVRKLLASVSDSQLRSGDYDLEKIYFHQDPAYRDAVAHVLLERGILVGMGDIVALLYILPTDAELGRQITGTWTCEGFLTSTNGMISMTNRPLSTMTISPDGSFSTNVGSTNALATYRGTWAVNCRHFETTVTNSQGGAIPVGSVARGEFIHTDARTLMLDQDGEMIIFNRKN